MMNSEELDNLLSDTIHRCRIDPIWFVDNVLKLPPMPKLSHHTEIPTANLDIWQGEMLEAAADVYRYRLGLPTKINHQGLNKITVRAMHGPGKTFGIALLAHWFNFCFKGTIPCTAPKQQQLLTRLWPAFRKIRNLADENYQSIMHVDSTKVTWWGDPDHVMIAETAATPDNLAGYHDEYLLFLIDEAPGVREEFYPIIEGAISTGIFTLLVQIGNPTNNQGSFYQSHMTPSVREYFHRVHVSLDKTTRVDPKWVDQMERKYGKGSATYKVRCLGEFADSVKGQLIAMSHIDSALVDEYIHDGTIPRLRISMDCNDGGDDDSVMTVGLHCQSTLIILKQMKFNFEPSVGQIELGKQLIKWFRHYLQLLHPRFGSIEGDIVVDALGVGTGCAGYVITYGEGIPVILYKGGSSSDNNKMWKNRRTQSYISLRDMFVAGKIQLVQGFTEDYDEFVQQLCSIRTINSEKYEELEPKRFLLDSPDTSDSLAMQTATQIPTIGEGVSIIDQQPQIMESAHVDFV